MCYNRVTTAKCTIFAFASSDVASGDTCPGWRPWGASTFYSAI